MTIKKRLALLNALLVALPLALTALFAAGAFHIYGRNYIAPLFEMYDAEQGVYSAQSLIYVCRELLGSEMWEEYDWYEDNGQVMPEQTSPKMRLLEKDLHDMGYHFEIAIHRKVVYSNFTDEDRILLRENFGGTLDSLMTLSATVPGGAVVKNGFGPDNERGSVTAVYVRGRETKDMDSYVDRYVIAFFAACLLTLTLLVTLTNWAVSSRAARWLVRRLGHLKEGSRHIAAGDLDFRLEDSEADEIGQVCREFNSMAERLKESVEEKLRYETCRRELISGISHDLRTPLTSLKGYSEGLLDGIADTPERRRRYYEAIHASTLRMESLADSLLTFSRLENRQYHYRLRPLCLRDFIRDTSEEFRTSCGGNITFRDGTGDEKVMIDAAEMGRLFFNILGNSLRYGGPSVPIDIRTWREGSQVGICISDKGPGVPEEDLPRIFESFFRGDRSRSHPEEGSGLGLSIARRIAEGHGGSITAENRGGLALTITLPAMACER